MEKAGNQLSRYGAIANPLPVAPNAKIFFVAGGNAVDKETLQYEFPVDKDGEVRVFTTIQAAVNAAKNGRGDVIYVSPKHVEEVNVAGGLTIDKDGVSIVGLGNGSERGWISIGGVTTASVVVDGANVAIKNMTFSMVGVDAIASPITVTGARFTLEDSYLNVATASAQATFAMKIEATAGGASLINNQFIGSANAGTTAAVQIIGGEDHTIKGNVFIGNYTAGTGAISNITTATLNAVIDGNIIRNGTASSTKAMTFVADSTPFIVNNRLAILSGTAPITAAGGFVGGNYYVAAAGVTAGVLI